MMVLWRSIFALGLLMSVLGLGLAQTNPSKGPSPEAKETASPTPPPTTDYDIKWGVKIPMRDKVELNATLYFPKTPDRSEERRVRKECRSRWSPYHEKKKKSNRDDESTTKITSPP